MGFTLDEEIRRAMSPYFNHVEPCLKGKVMSISGSHATVKLTETEMPIPDVPILQPTYKEGSMTLNISVGDSVLVCFLKGLFGSPLIIGKF